MFDIFAKLVLQVAIYIHLSRVYIYRGKYSYFTIKEVGEKYYNVACFFRMPARLLIGIIVHRYS